MESNITDIYQRQNQCSFQEYRPEKSTLLKWVHGTSGLCLLFLKRTEHRVIPTGRLLERRIAPITGEFCSGISLYGINQYATSGMKFQNAQALQTVWHYATLSTDYERYDEYLIGDIESNLKKVETSVQNEENFLHQPLLKRLAINVLRLRQLDGGEKLYRDKFYDRIKNLKGIERIENYLLYSRILRMRKRMEVAISRDEVELLSHDFDAKLRFSDIPYDQNDDLLCYKNEAINAHFCAFIANQVHQIGQKMSKQDFSSFIFNIKRSEDYSDHKWSVDKTERLLHRDIARITKAFEDSPTPICFSKEEVERIRKTKFFPLVLASTKIEGLSEEGDLQESPVRHSLLLGKDIDVLITDEDHFKEVQQYVQEYGFEKEVSVFTNREFEHISGRKFN